jgi:hypothetical protein
VRAREAKGAPSSSRARTHDTGCAVDHEEGLRASKGTRTFARVDRSSGPRSRASARDARDAAGSSCTPLASREASACANAIEEHVAPRPRSRTDIPRVIARASSVCRSRQAVFGLEKARPRRRAGRKLVRSKRRVDASLAARGRTSRSATAPRDPRRENVEGRTRRKENGSFERGDPHHVSVASRS